MEEPGQEVVYLSLEEICVLNRRMIRSSGGRFVPLHNLANRAALEYILAMIQLPYGGFCPYPTPEEKAAALAYHIISRHVFWDGNKRTGIFSAWTFLKLNNIHVDLGDPFEEAALAVASGQAGMPELLALLKEYRRP